MKIGISFPVDDLDRFRIQMLNWANRFSIFCFLDNRHYDFSRPAFECLLAAGCKANIETNAGMAYEELQHFYAAHKGEWIFGHFGYDLKNETEDLVSVHPDGVGFSDLHFFVPLVIVELGAGMVKITCDSGAEAIYREIRECPGSVPEKPAGPIAVQHRMDRDSYTGIIERLRQHILRGDCYEINFCQEFYATQVKIDPLTVYCRLTQVSPNPFSVFYKVHTRYCLCASPERYLKGTGNRILSQPIKGTAKRNLEDNASDEAAKHYLLQSPKEKSENVMVVDLVRNDLSRICRPGSVKVEELFGIYSFPQVHQMISTVSGELNEGLNWVDCVKATFPMGSMTGAPKKKVMQLIEQYEHTKRGLFSGAIGYINPEADFDLNVVIRSIFYNETTGYLSFQAGGGITYYSEAASEYEECMIKAEAMMKVLGQ